MDSVNISPFVFNKGELLIEQLRVQGHEVVAFWRNYYADAVGESEFMKRQGEQRRINGW